MTSRLRKELEKVQDEKRDLLTRNLDAEESYHEQIDACMRILGDVLRLVWSLSNSPDCLRFMDRICQPLKFLTLCKSILAQLLEKDEEYKLLIKYRAEILYLVRTTTSSITLPVEFSAVSSILPARRTLSW